MEIMAWILRLENTSIFYIFYYVFVTVTKDIVMYNSDSIPDLEKRL